MLERWSKLADSQLKLGATVPSSIKFANAQVVEASEVQLRGKGKGFLEEALEQAEQARNDLAGENRMLKGLVISAGNELQKIMHSTKGLVSVESLEEVCYFAFLFVQYSRNFFSLRH